MIWGVVAPRQRLCGAAVNALRQLWCSALEPGTHAAYTGHQLHILISCRHSRVHQFQCRHQITGAGEFHDRFSFPQFQHSKSIAHCQRGCTGFCDKPPPHPPAAARPLTSVNFKCYLSKCRSARSQVLACGILTICIFLPWVISLNRTVFDMPVQLHDLSWILPSPTMLMIRWWVFLTDTRCHCRAWHDTRSHQLATCEGFQLWTQTLGNVQTRNNACPVRRVTVVFCVPQWVSGSQFDAASAALAACVVQRMQIHKVA